MTLEHAFRVYEDLAWRRATIGITAEEQRRLEDAEVVMDAYEAPIRIPADIRAIVDEVLRGRK